MVIGADQSWTAQGSQTMSQLCDQPCLSQSVELNNNELIDELWWIKDFGFYSLSIVLRCMVHVFPPYFQRVATFDLLFASLDNKILTKMCLLLKKRIDPKRAISFL